MNSLRPLLATIAMIPAMVGPAPAKAGATLVMALCNGGTIVVPVGGGDTPAGPQQGPCCAKGCHSGDRRKGQLKSD